MDTARSNRLRSLSCSNRNPLSSLTVMPKIPNEFHSLETDETFKNCCDCNCELLDSAQMYMVQKCFSKDECVMEFALCHNCKEKLDEQISGESKEAIYDFLFDHAEMVEPPEDYSFDDAMQQIQECLTCGKERKDCEGYTYSGLFVGTHLVPGPLPMMICDDCQSTMSENMSDHTKDVKDKFYADNFPGPPSEVDMPTSKPVFF